MPAEQFDVHPNEITQWRAQLLEGASGVFGEAPAAKDVPAVDVKTLHAKIGELTQQSSFVMKHAGGQRGENTPQPTPAIG